MDQRTSKYCKNLGSQKISLKTLASKSNKIRHRQIKFNLFMREKLRAQSLLVKVQNKSERIYRVHLTKYLIKVKNISLESKIIKANQG